MVNDELYPGEVDEVDEIAEFVRDEQITAVSTRVDIRPDVARAELAAWSAQDPEYPVEHYHCIVSRKGRTLELFQTVGADYPDEDEEPGSSIDLYTDNRELLLSPEFLIESAALKANSIDQAADLDDWIKAAYCETTTPEQTYEQYKAIRKGLYDMLGDSLYQSLVRMALEAELEREEGEDEI